MRIETTVRVLRWMTKGAQTLPGGGADLAHLAYILQILAMLQFKGIEDKQAIGSLLEMHREPRLFESVQKLTDAQWKHIISQIVTNGSLSDIQALRPYGWQPTFPAPADLEPDPTPPKPKELSLDQRKNLEHSFNTNDPIPDGTIPPEFLTVDEAVRRKDMSIPPKPIVPREQRIKELMSRLKKPNTDETIRAIVEELSDLRNPGDARPDASSGPSLNRPVSAQVNQDRQTWLAYDWLYWMAEAGFFLDKFEDVQAIAQQFGDQGAQIVSHMTPQQYQQVWEKNIVQEHARSTMERLDAENGQPRRQLRYMAPPTQPTTQNKPPPPAPYREPGTMSSSTMRNVPLPPPLPTKIEPQTSPRKQPPGAKPPVEEQPAAKEVRATPGWDGSDPESIEGNEADATPTPMPGFVWGQALTYGKKTSNSTVKKVLIRPPRGSMRSITTSAVPAYVGMGVWIQALKDLGIPNPKGYIVGMEHPRSISVWLPFSGGKFAVVQVDPSIIEVDKTLNVVPGFPEDMMDEVKRNANIILLGQAIPANPQVSTTSPQQPPPGPGADKAPKTPDGKPAAPGDYIQPINNGGSTGDPNGQGTIQKVNPDGSVMYNDPSGIPKVKQPGEQVQVVQKT